MYTSLLIKVILAVQVILDSIVDTVEPDSKRARTHEELLTLTAE